MKTFAFTHTHQGHNNRLTTGLCYLSIRDKNIDDECLASDGNASLSLSLSLSLCTSRSIMSLPTPPCQCSGQFYKSRWSPTEGSNGNVGVIKRDGWLMFGPATIEK